MTSFRWPDPRRNTTLRNNPLSPAINGNTASALPNGSLNLFSNNNGTRNGTDSKAITIGPTVGTDSRTIFGALPARSVNSRNLLLNGSITTGESSPLLKTGNAPAGQSPQHEDALDRSVTIMFGPPENPDQNIMPAATTSRLPKTVLSVIMKSKSKTQSDLGPKSILLKFTTSRWRKFLTKVHQYIQTGEYAPWGYGTQLEVVDAAGNRVAWSPWMSAAPDIHEAKTTDETHQFFLEELQLYNWACFTHFDQLKEHSLHKIHNDFPILAHEALALVEFFCPETNDFPPTEEMKAFTQDAVMRNRKNMSMLADFRKTFQKAIKNNFPAILLEDVQHDLVTFLKDVRDMSQPMPQPMPEPSPSATVERLLQSSMLENYINTGALRKAVKDGFGTLLPSITGPVYRPTRNEDFRFAKDELLIIRFECRSFNPPRNIVVENMRGQRGDMLRDLLVPLNLLLSQSPKGPVAVPETRPAQQSSPPTAPKAMQTVRSPQTKVKPERPGSSNSHGHRADRSPASRRGRSRCRSHSPESKKRKYRSRSRSRSYDLHRRHTVRWPAYGRR